MKEIFENLFILIGNIFILGAIYYAVFFLGYSGWWFALFLIFNFSASSK